MNRLLILLILVLGQSCNKDNDPPSCILFSPDDDTFYYRGDPILIWVDASDPEGNISTIKIFVDGTEHASITGYPYYYVFETEGLDPGDHSFRVVVIDHEGLESSDEARITLREAVTGLTDYDRNSYRVTEIGDQTWMAENLKVTHYSDGTAIEPVDNEWDWFLMDEEAKAYCWYNDEVSNGDIFGALYTWAAAMNGADSIQEDSLFVQGVCPDGWHLPSDEEWKQLELHLGMSQENADDLGVWRGDSIGGILKESGNMTWTYPNVGATNESGFAAVPGRARYYDGTFDTQDLAVFWTSTEYDSLHSLYRGLGGQIEKVYRDYFNKTSGFSVRCVKDD